MRLDLRRFTRERYAGILVAIVTAVAALIAYASIIHLQDVERYYLGGFSDTFRVQNPLQFKHLLKSYDVVAVMFEAPTCPHCKRLRPYWHQVELMAPLISRQLGVNVSVNHVMYDAATDPIFREYNVRETPTLILFIRGEPVSVKSYVDFGPEFVPDPVKTIREWITSTVEAHKGLLRGSGSKAARAEQHAAAMSAGGTPLWVMIVTALVAGVLAAFSPCVLPLLLVYIAGTAASAKRLSGLSCTLCALAAAAGALAIGGLFAVAGGVASAIQELLLPAVAVTVTVLGVALALGVPMEFGSARIARRGLLGFCGLYGILSLQCSLPLVVGALLLAVSTGSIVTGAIVALAFAASLGGSLGAVLYASSALGAGIANKLLEKSDLLNRIGGVIMTAAGLYLLLYVNGLA